MNNAAIWGTLGSGALMFLAAVLVPIVTRKANKASDASASAKASAETAESFTNTARELVDGVNKQLADNKKELAANRKTCDACLSELEAMKLRAARRDRALDAVHKALVEIERLLPASGEATDMLRAAIRSVARTRYED
jgi:hypothetical protein